MISNKLDTFFLSAINSSLKAQLEILKITLNKVNLMVICFQLTCCAQADVLTPIAIPNQSIKVGNHKYIQL